MNEVKHDFKKVYITDKPHRAEIVMAVLEDHDIRTAMIDKRDSSYLFGDIEVFVAAEHIEKALDIIRQNDL
ncbi:MAG: putative signal transducing protein [Bacteroidota bacterium]